MEFTSRALPANWEAGLWDTFFPRIARLLAEREAELNDAEKDTLFTIGCMMHRRMTERFEAMSLADIMIEQARNGGGK
jgi:hypothetical protein